MLSLPAPFGPHIVNEYQGIHVMIETNKGTIPWADIPSSCDPMRFMGIKQDERRMPHLSDLMNHLGLPFHVNVKTQPGPSESDATQTKADDMAVHDANVIRRAQQKRDQIESFYHILKKMLTSEEVRSRHGSEIRTRVVDFGAGTGALALPLAFLFPFSDFVAVEMKETSLAILNKRKNEAGLSNLTIFHGMIESFDTPFDVSVSLHGCGCASDQAIKLSRHHRAAFIVSSCCIGKIGFTATGGSSFSPSPGDYEFSPKVSGASKEEVARAGELLRGQLGLPDRSRGGNSVAAPIRLDLEYPQSRLLRSALGKECQSEFYKILSIADTHDGSRTNKSHSIAIATTTGEGDTFVARLSTVLKSILADKTTAADGAWQFDEAERRAAMCALAKAHIEMDRVYAAREDERPYTAGLYRMLNDQTMAKGDVIVGVPSHSQEERDRWSCLLNKMGGGKQAFN